MRKKSKKITYRPLSILVCSVVVATFTMPIFLYSQIGKEQLLEANEASERGDFDKAEELYDLAAKNGVNKAIIFYNKANMYYRQDKINAAVENYREVIFLAPQFRKAYLNLGKLYFLVGNYPEALSVFSSYLKVEETDYETHVLVGDAKRVLQDYSGALRNYLFAIDLRPTEAEAYLAIAGLFLDIGDMENSLSWLEEGEKLVPNSVDLILTRAQTLYDAEEFSRAAELFSLAIIEYRNQYSQVNDEKRREQIDDRIYRLRLRLADSFYESDFFFLAIYELKELIDEYPERNEAIRVLEAFWAPVENDMDAFLFFSNKYKENEKEYYRIIRNLLARAYNNNDEKLIETILDFYKRNGLEDDVSILVSNQ